MAVYGSFPAGDIGAPQRAQVCTQSGDRGNGLLAFGSIGTDAAPIGPNAGAVAAQLLLQCVLLRDEDRCVGPLRHKTRTAFYTGPNPRNDAGSRTAKHTVLGGATVLVRGWPE